ncbi:MAG: hypothetical protein P8M01_08360, partial [Amylibacter sp.]|nr:hypothetical protein [Amylibacter sp.]
DMLSLIPFAERVVYAERFVESKTVLTSTAEALLNSLGGLILFPPVTVIALLALSIALVLDNIVFAAQYLAQTFETATRLMATVLFFGYFVVRSVVEATSEKLTFFSHNDATNTVVNTMDSDHEEEELDDSFLQQSNSAPFN